MAVGSKDLVSEQLRSFDDDRLVDELRKAKEELFNLRFQSATGQLESHGRLRAVSTSAPGGVVDVALEDVEPGNPQGWVAYLAGVCWVLGQEGYALPGLDVAIASEVPVGAGLSSSAALECALVAALSKLAPNW